MPAALLALVLGVAATGLAVTPAWAASLTVTTTADGDANEACTISSVTTPAVPTTLRNALCVASNLGGANTVVVPAGSYTLGALGALVLGTQPGSELTIEGAGDPTIVGNGTTQLMSIDPGLVGDVEVTIDGLVFDGGVDSVYGGGAIIAGAGDAAAADSLTVLDSTFTGNSAGAGTSANPGGAIQFMGGALTIDGSTFTGNDSGLSAGGAVYYAVGGGGGQAFTVTDSSFHGNTATAVGALANGGGALAYAGGSAAVELTGNTFDGNSATSVDGAPTPGGAIWHQSGTATISGNTFTGNSSAGAGARGGAIDAENGAVTAQYNRIAGNTGAAAVRSDAAASVTATRNWWGCSTGPAAVPCDTSVIANGTASPHLVFGASAAPASIGATGTSTLSASLLTDSAGDPVPASQLGAFDVLPVAWSGVGPAGASVTASNPVFAGGLATTTFTAGALPGVGGATATLDSAAVPVAIVVTGPTAFTSADTATFAAGASGSFAIATSGYPTATVSLTAGTLPAGLVFTPGAGGSATISGTPAAGVAGEFVVTLSATNGATTATQELAVIVTSLPVFTSDAHATVLAGAVVDLDIAASGFPTPVISVGTGVLPPGLVLADHGDGTASITGAVARADVGWYALELVASSGAGTATQPYTITVGAPPVFTGTAVATFTAGTPGSLTLTVDAGFPESVTFGSAGLPAWASMTAVGADSVTFGGTPAVGGVFTFTATATNATGSDDQLITITVNEAPTVTTQPAAASVLDGATATFIAAATGYPAPTVQWQRSIDGTIWADVAGATSPTLSFAAALADDGSRYRAVFSSAGVGTATSDVASLAVGTAPDFGGIAPVTVLPGAPRSFTVSVAGHPSPAITVVDGLPGWLTFTDNGDGTATFSGTPSVADDGLAVIQLQAVNAFGTALGSLSAEVNADVPPPIVLPTPDGVLGGVPAETRRGQVVTVTGDGFLPGAPIMFGIYSTPTGLGAATADGSGAFTASVVIPAEQSLGAHTIVATGVGATGAARLLAAGTTVVEPAPPGGGAGSGSGAGSGTGSLSATGVEPIGWMLLAGFVLALGAVLVRRSRRA